ncbi:hypothetical protein FJT64_012154 [Amphibalanus amphitrite]|uniref:Uncharacterized protein n=1 Tax=Amphibalanus amphitrite TaxID=1232801 RepID=A0A6A4VJS1_AMPAM|nr:hypothetical protein FJT64_012154 [Amphibalanus amphitrite]
MITAFYLILATNLETDNHVYLRTSTQHLQGVISEARLSRHARSSPIQQTSINSVPRKQKTSVTKIRTLLSACISSMDIIHHESVVLLIFSLGHMEVLLIYSLGRMEVHSSIARLVHLRHICSVSQGIHRNSHLIILLNLLPIFLSLPSILRSPFFTNLLHRLIILLNLPTILLNLPTSLPNLITTLLNLPITLLRPLTIQNSPSIVLRVGSYHHKPAPVVEEPLYRLLRTSEVDHSFLNLCHIFLHSLPDLLLGGSSSLCRFTLDGATVVIQLQLLLDRLSWVCLTIWITSRIFLIPTS